MLTLKLASYFFANPKVTIPRVTVTQEGMPVTAMREDIDLESMDFAFTVNENGMLVPTGDWTGQTESGETRTFDADDIMNAMHMIRVNGDGGAIITDSTTAVEGAIQDVVATKVIFVTTDGRQAAEANVVLDMYTATTSNGVTTYTHEDAVGCTDGTDENECEYTAGYLAQYVSYTGTNIDTTEVVEGDNVVNRVTRNNRFWATDTDDAAATPLPNGSIITHEAVAEDVVTGLSIDGHQITVVTVEDGENGLTVNVPVQNVTISEDDQTITIPGTLEVATEGEEGQPTVIDVTPGMASHYKTTEKVVKGSRDTHIAAQFNLGAVSAYLGYSQSETNGSSAKNKTTHYGVSGGLGDTGMSFHLMARNKDNANGMDTNPWLVGLTKGLGGGATVMVEHGNADDGESGKTRFGLKVDF